MNKEPEDQDFTSGIFTDEDEVIDNMRENAEALGINPDLVASKDEKTRYIAKGNCKYCFGKGTITVCLSPSKPKVFWKNLSKRSERKQQRPSGPRRKLITGMSPGNELDEQWSKREKFISAERAEKRKRTLMRLLGKVPDHSRSATSRPEPPDYKKRNTSLAFCKCVRAI